MFVSVHTSLLSNVLCLMGLSPLISIKLIALLTRSPLSLSCCCCCRVSHGRRHRVRRRHGRARVRDWRRSAGGETFSVCTRLIDKVFAVAGDGIGRAGAVRMHVSILAGRLHHGARYHLPAQKVIQNILPLDARLVTLMTTDFSQRREVRKLLSTCCVTTTTPWLRLQTFWRRCCAHQVCPNPDSAVAHASNIPQE